MIRSSLVSFSIVSSLSACNAASAASTPPSAAYLAASLVADPLAEKNAPAKHSRPASRPSRSLHARPTSPLDSGDVASEVDAVVSASAMEIYPWSEGSLYWLRTAPEQVSDIALQPGEALVSVAAGDTSRWVIGETSSGSGPERRSHVLVKPAANGLRTNLLIATDRRVYHLQVASGPRPPMTSISWTYPDDALLALRRSAPVTPQPVAAGVTADSLNFNYRIDGDQPSWRPVRAFDDGHQVFIEFPPNLSEGEAPPLFVRGEGGRAELVNYRVRGRYYVVDRLFAAAELRLGERRQQVVRITREGRKPS